MALKRGAKMSWFVSYYRTTVGKKVVMAVTGILLFLFVLGHMAGNLQIFIGKDQLNAYAAALHSQSFAPILWTVRVVMGLSLILHVVASIQLTVHSWNSRPQKYAKIRYREANIAARTMILSGPIIAFFLIYHILQLTTGNIQPSGEFALQASGAPDAYTNVVAGFQVWWVSLGYIVAVILLGFHFYHGLWSWTQTLGWDHPKWNGLRRGLATFFCVAIVIGDIAIPLAVLAGWIK
jgi:succinate dehydrogenase / fumarate reductase cytochrome b subunit